MVVRALQRSPAGLFGFKGFEQRLEVALAEAVTALALNDLEEEGGEASRAQIP